MSDPLIGRTLKETYRIDRMLADGGMSRVYLAEQLSLARKVVVKMLLPSFHDEDFVQLFLREARICSHLNHPNIVSVLDFGSTEDGLVYLILEYLEGASLADIVLQQKGLSLANIAWLMEPLCSAINAAHQQNVVHRYYLVQYTHLLNIQSIHFDLLYNDIFQHLYQLLHYNHQ